MELTRRLIVYLHLIVLVSSQCTVVNGPFHDIVYQNHPYANVFSAASGCSCVSPPKTFTITNAAGLTITIDSTTGVFNLFNVLSTNGAGLYQVQLTCDDTDVSAAVALSYYFTVKADDPISAGYTIPDWEIDDATSSGQTFVLGEGVFIDNDLDQQNYIVTTSALPAWLSYNTAT